MVTAKVAPEHCLALARAASQHASAAHAPGHAVPWLAVIGLAAACLAAYRISLWLHPFTLCRRCGGTGITAGFFPWSTGVLPQMRRPRAGSPARHADGRPVGTVPAVTARSPVPAARIPCRGPRQGPRPAARADAGTRNGPGSPGQPWPPRAGARRVSSAASPVPGRRAGSRGRRPVTTAGHARSRRAAARPASAGVRRAGGSRVRPVAGVLLLAVVCALVLAEGRVRAGGREPVLALARPVAAGQVITASDLRVVDVSAAGPVSVVPAWQQDQVAGRTAAASLPAGSLLAAGDVGGPSPARGRAWLGVALKPGRYPPGLSPGQHVGVLTAPAPGSGARAARWPGTRWCCGSPPPRGRARQHRRWPSLTCRGMWYRGSPPRPRPGGSASR